MHCAADLWAFRELRPRLVDVIHDFAGMGFEAVSGAAFQFLDVNDEEIREITAAIGGRGLLVTVHTKFELPPSDARRLADLLGESLYSITFDPLLAGDPPTPDVHGMARHLQELLRATDGSQVRFGIEDFPLDTTTLRRHRTELDPLLESGRYGMLLDIGHMYLRLRGAQPPIPRAIIHTIDDVPVPIVELHVHDNRGERDDHAYLGYGVIPFDKVVTALQRRGFEGVATFEITPPYYGNTLEEGKQQVRESLTKWRRLWDDGNAERRRQRQGTG